MPKTAIVCPSYFRCYFVSHRIRAECSSWDDRAPSLDESWDNHIERSLCVLSWLAWSNNRNWGGIEEIRISHAQEMEDETMMQVIVDNHHPLVRELCITLQLHLRLFGSRYLQCSLGYLRSSWYYSIQSTPRDIFQELLDHRIHTLCETYLKCICKQKMFLIMIWHNYREKNVRMREKIDIVLGEKNHSFGRVICHPLYDRARCIPERL